MTQLLNYLIHTSPSTINICIQPMAAARSLDCSINRVTTPWVGRYGVLCSPKCLDWFWGPPILKFDGHQELIGKGNQSMSMTTHLHLVQSTGTTGVISPLPLHPFIACTGASVPLPSTVTVTVTFKMSEHHNYVNFSM